MSLAITVGIIGPGRVGTALAMSLPAERYSVVAVAGMGSQSLTRFSAAVPSATVMDASALAATVDLVVLAVPDDTLSSVVRELVVADAVKPGSYWLHTAGGHGLAVLRPLQLAGAHIAACHPAQTFPDPHTGAAALPGTAWAVTTEGHDSDWAEAFVHALDGVVVPVAEQNRTLYHAALVVGANGASSVVAQARELLRGAGIENPEAFLAPLTTAAVQNAALQGVAALTGPVRRGDAGTVATHLEQLAVAMPEAVETYRALAQLALRQALRAGLDAQRAEAVREVLEGKDG